MGEAFDKVARILGLPYPGGPEIQKLGNLTAIPKPPSSLVDDLIIDGKWSVSLVENFVLYYLADDPKANKADVAS